MDRLILGILGFVASVIFVTLVFSLGESRGIKGGYEKAHIESMGETLGTRVAACKAINGIPTMQGNEVFCLLKTY